MDPHILLISLILAASAMADDPPTTVVDPRGARPMVQGTRSDKCETQKEWPLCTDDEWYHKCPSGCRIQGLMDKTDHTLLKKIEKIRNLLDQYKAKHRSTDLVSKQTYDYLKEKLTTDSGNDNSYYDLAQNLRQKIVNMKIKIDKQLGVLVALKQRVKDQVVEMQKLEVDIDIKLRACKGSCKSYSEYSVDQDSYVELNKQVNQLDPLSTQQVETVSTLYVMKSKPLKEMPVSPFYKSKEFSSDPAAQQLADVFHEVNTMALTLEKEGSSSSPATVSKVPGTSYSSSTSSGTSYSTSSKSITELGGTGGAGDTGELGGGFSGGQPSTGHVTTYATTCTKSIKTITVHTKDGPVEKTEEVIEGGPGCEGMTEMSAGGLDSLFPTLSHTSSSSSSSSSSSIITKSQFSGGAKGSIYGDSKGFMDPFSSHAGMDLGGFMTGHTDDDVPDFHARSVKSAPVKREADYIGKDCVDAYQKHLKGETNGLFKIKPAGMDSTDVVEVYCQQDALMGGWLLVQQRESGTLDFNRTWAEYRKGFGSVDAQGKGEFWLGNQNLHLLTNQGETLLKVDLEDWEGGVATAEYVIRVGSEEEGYPLHVSGYSGDAGDALVMPASDMASYLSHNGMKFSTFDRDNDKWEENCAEMFAGGWWYNNCRSANLNGIYYKGSYDPEKNTPYEIENGVVWVTYKPANYSLKTVRMFVRPAAF